MPSAIAAAALRVAQNGGSASAPRLPLAISARVITPVVFCASLAPWASGQQAAGDDLGGAEAAADRPRPAPAEDPVGEDDRAAGDDEGEQRRDQRRHQDLAEQAAASRTASIPAAASGGADDAADQRVRGARRAGRATR